MLVPVAVSIPTKRLKTNISTIAGIKSSTLFCLAAHCKDESERTQNLARVWDGQPSSEEAHLNLVRRKLAVRGVVAVGVVGTVLLIGDEGFLGRPGVLANIISVMKEHCE